MTDFGLCVGNDHARATAWETWSKKQAAYLSAHGGKADWADWENSLDYALWQCGMAGRPLVVTMPMFPNGCTLAAGVSGAYDAHYTYQAQRILTKYNSTDVVRNSQDIHIRTGEEFNGGWFAWASLGKEADFAALFRRIVGLFAAVSPRFKFWICPNVGQNNPMLSYPGDDVVYGFGLDVYAMDEDGTDPVAAWANQCSKPYGVNWFFKTAQAHNKPTAIWEWGVRADGWGSYVAAAIQRFRAEGALWANYWENEGGPYAGTLQADRYPETSRVFRAALGGLDVATDNTPVAPTIPNACASPNNFQAPSWSKYGGSDVDPTAWGHGGPGYSNLREFHQVNAGQVVTIKATITRVEGHANSGPGALSPHAYPALNSANPVTDGPAWPVPAPGGSASVSYTYPACTASGSYELGFALNNTDACEYAFSNVRFEIV